MTPRRAVLAVALVLVAAALPARAQPVSLNPVISPDRPDLSNGIQIVPVGHIQIEGGATAARTGGTTDLTVGELTVRIPFSSRAEVRVQAFTWGANWGGEGQNGAMDPVVDVKWKLFDSESTDFGVIAGSSIPAGARAYGEPHFQPYAVVAVDEVISEMVSFTVNAGGASASSGGATYGQLFGGLSMSLQVSPRASLFLEGFGWSRTEPDGPGEQLIDGGLQYLLTDRLMLDARVGFGFGRTASDGFAGIGAAILF